MKKRILSIVMTLIMLISMIPLPARAAEQSGPVNLGRTAVTRMCKGDYPSGEWCNNAFDGNLDTKWSMYGNGWVFFTLPDPVLLKYIRIYHADSCETETVPYNTVDFQLEVLDESRAREESMEAAGYPRSWVENDNLWTTVAAVTGNRDSITNTPVSMTEGRTMFRLNITNAGRDNTVRIYEVELFDTVPDRFEGRLDGAHASVDGEPVTSARPGETVTVTTDDPESPGRYFNHWETNPENLVLSAPLSSTTTFIMPESDVHMEPIYSDSNTMYSIIVDNGTATVHGTPVTAAPQGVTVTLTADPAPEGQTFDSWESVDSFIILDDYYSPSIPFYVSDFNIHLKAVYKKAITQVSISDLTLPSRGANPDFEVTLPPDAPYHMATPNELRDHGYYGDALMYNIDGISWRESVFHRYMSEGYVFDSPKEGAYYAQFTILPNEGYAFTKDVSIIINGSDSLAGKPQFKGSMLYFDTIPLTAHLADPTERPIIVENGTATVYGDIVTTAPGGVFVTLDADPAPEGQAFSYWEVVSGNITVSHRPSYTFLMPTEPVHVRAVYGKIITEVSISDLTLPVIGAHPDIEVTLPPDAPYHLATPAEMERAGYSHNLNSVSWMENNSFENMTPEDTFYNPSQDMYYARFILVPNEGYAFTGKTVVWVNGSRELVDYRGVQYLLSCSTKSMTAAPGPVMDYRVDVEGGTASVDGIATTSVRVGSTVTLTADPAPEGKFFLRWEVISGHSPLADIDAESTTFTMYAEDFHVKAVFVTPIEEVALLDLTMPILGAHPDFEVTVPPDAPYHLASREEMAANGFINVDSTYNGIWWLYNNGDSAMGTEDVFEPDVEDYYAALVLAPNEGYRFTTGSIPVTINGGYELVRSVMANWAGYLYIKTQRVPAAAAPVTQYAVTVEDGTAFVDGEPVTAAPADTTVTLTADPAPEGQVFDQWKVTGGKITLADSKAESTTFTMPARDVAVKAVYKNVPSTQEPIRIEFIKETSSGQRVTERTIPVDGSLKVPAPGGFGRNERCWLGEDGRTVLLKNERIDHATAQTLQSAATDGVIRFYSVLRRNLTRCELTVRFLDGQEEVGSTSLRIRLDEKSIPCLLVQQFLPEGYIFADNQDQSIRNQTVTFQVAPLAGDRGPLQMTLKMGFGSWRLENGQKTMTVILEPGESFTLPDAQNRKGAEGNVCWSVNGEELRLWSGRRISYEELAQFLSILTDGGDELHFQGKVDNSQIS